MVESRWSSHSQRPGYVVWCWSNMTHCLVCLTCRQTVKWYHEALPDRTERRWSSRQSSPYFSTFKKNNKTRSFKRGSNKHATPHRGDLVLPCVSSSVIGSKDPTLFVVLCHWLKGSYPVCRPLSLAQRLDDLWCMMSSSVYSDFFMLLSDRSAASWSGRHNGLEKWWRALKGDNGYFILKKVQASFRFEFGTCRESPQRLTMLAHKS